MVGPDVTTMAHSWRRHLTAANLSPKTVATYMEAAGQLAAFLTEEGMPVDVTDIGREHVEAFIIHVTDTRSASTANNRYRALQQFFKWLAAEEEIDTNPFDRMRPPKMEEKEIPVVGAADLRRLFAACEGKDFDSRRDLALFTFMLDTGARLEEVGGLRVDQVDLDLGVALVLGKGRRERTLPFSPTTTQRLDRYLRTRARHKAADSPWLWLGQRGKLSDSGIRQALTRRSRQAGIEPAIHPHQLRHTFADRFLAAGGQETDLMRLTGWRSPQMVARYAASTGARRAREAHRRFSPVEGLQDPGR